MRNLEQRQLKDTHTQSKENPCGGPISNQKGKATSEKKLFPGGSSNKKTNSNFKADAESTTKAFNKMKRGKKVERERKRL